VRGEADETNNKQKIKPDDKMCIHPPIFTHYKSIELKPHHHHTTLKMSSSRPCRIGIVGFGSLGQYLVKQSLSKPDQLQVVFVWNRSPAAIEQNAELLGTSSIAVLRDLKDFATHSVDLIVEVAHPSISEQFGAQFLAHADYFCGSPTAFADAQTEAAVRSAATAHQHTLYIPAGALWGANDIAKMAQRGTLRALRISMAKHPLSLKLDGELATKLADAAKVTDRAVVLYEGPVRALCPLAPNNVNTMACAALAGLGFDATHATLISDARLQSHDIEIDIEGPVNKDTGQPFRCITKRINPAAVGAVTGSATYVSFFSSLLDASAYKRGGGVHFV
jgi:aspartate dehydrogenase